MVYSRFRFCRRARELGIPVLAVNRGFIRTDGSLAAKVDADRGQVLPALVSRLTRPRFPAARPTA